MQILWCWRCKMNVPMLDDGEWNEVWSAFQGAATSHGDRRPLALAAYERITGLKESNFNAIFHHRISQHGPPCPRCGKVLRTKTAYKCFECGLQLHEPNWTFLFHLEVDAFSVPGRGVVAIARKEAVENRLSAGDGIEFRQDIQVIARTTLISIERFFHVTASDDSIGLLLETNVSSAKIVRGQDAWLVSQANVES